MSNKIKRLAVNGKYIESDKIKGYDCAYFQWHDPTGSLLFSQCHLGNNKYYKDCKFIDCPKQCKNFKLRENIKNKLEK